MGYLGQISGLIIPGTLNKCDMMCSYTHDHIAIDDMTHY